MIRSRYRLQWLWSNAIVATAFITAATLRAQQQQVDTLVVNTVSKALGSFADSVEASRRKVDARDARTADAPTADAVKKAIKNQQVLIVRSAGKLMTQLQIGSASINTVLTSFDFGLQLGFTANPLSSPTLTTAYDKIERFINFAPPLAFAVALKATNDRSKQLNVLAISLAAVELLRAGKGRATARANAVSDALSNAKAVTDFLAFDRYVYADAIRLGASGKLARNADQTLKNDIDTFMTRYGKFPTDLLDDQITSHPDYQNYINEAIPLIERFQTQLSRTDNFFIQAKSSVESYDKYLADLGPVPTNAPAPTKSIAADAMEIVKKLRASRNMADKDWTNLSALLQVTPNRVAGLREFYTLQQLITTVR